MVAVRGEGLLRAAFEALPNVGWICWMLLSTCIRESTTWAWTKMHSKPYIIVLGL